MCASPETLEHLQAITSQLDHAIRTALRKYEKELCQPAELRESTDPGRRAEVEARRKELGERKKQHKELVLSETRRFTRMAVSLYKELGTAYKEAQELNGPTPKQIRDKFIQKVGTDLFEKIGEVMQATKELRQLADKLGFGITDFDPQPEFDAYIRLEESLTAYETDLEVQKRVRADAEAALQRVLGKTTTSSGDPQGRSGRPKTLAKHS